MYIKVCDLCGKRINDNTILGKRYELIRCVGMYETKMHICDDCMKRITSEIKAENPQTERSE